MTGFNLVGTQGNTFRLNTSKGNWNGVQATNASSGNSFVLNTSTSNLMFGFLVESGSDGNAFVENLIAHNGSDGLRLNTGGNTVVDNEFAHNGDQGFVVGFYSGSWIEGNESHHNGTNGFNAYGADLNTFVRNTATHNGRNGFHANSLSQGNTFTEDTSCQNQWDDAAETAPPDNTWSDNEFCTPLNVYVWP